MYVLKHPNLQLSINISGKMLNILSFLYYFLKTVFNKTNTF